MRSFLHVFTAALLLAFEVGAAPHAYHQHIERQDKGPTVTITVTAGAEVTAPAPVPVPDPNNLPPPPPPDHNHEHDHQQQPHHNHDHHHPHPHPHPHGHPHPPPDAKPKRQFGISYSPYNTDSTCKSQEEVTNDLAGLSPDYAFIRIYGVDCNQTATVTTAAKQHDMQVFAGIFDLTDFPNSLQPIIDVANGGGDGGDGTGWEIFHTIAIGNELIVKNQNTVEEVTSALHTARSKLRAAGYKGPVVTVDVYSVLLDHPALCDASDYCATNCHVFFDATQTPENAGGYATDVARKISKNSGGKRTVVAESGWPHAGGANGEAVPSARNQRVAVESLRREFQDQEELGLVLFTAFDDLWKVDGEGTFGAERFWGIQR